jgi:MFS family permease
VLPALIGPLIAGLVTTHLSWRLVFLPVPGPGAATGATTLATS